MNPNAICILWTLTILMAGAIASGPHSVLAVGAATIVYGVIGVLT